MKEYIFEKTITLTDSSGKNRHTFKQGDVVKGRMEGDQRNDTARVVVNMANGTYSIAIGRRAVIKPLGKSVSPEKPYAEPPSRVKTKKLVTKEGWSFSKLVLPLLGVGVILLLVGISSSKSTS